MESNNIPAGQWQRWIELARRYDHWKAVAHAIKSIPKPQGKPKVSMSRLPSLDDPPHDTTDPPDCVLS